MSEINAGLLPATQMSEHELAMTVSPEDKLEAGRKAAVSLKRMIDETNSKVKIGTSEHIKVEAWQTVGSFFHVTTKTDAEPCEIDGVKGAKGHAVLIDDITGQVVGGAESYCMRDEDGRRNMPWFKIASMAQTRAASKALANKFKWITVMAGYSPTPAEEMESPQHEPNQSKSNDDLVTFQNGQLIASIKEMLGKMNGGDEDLMDRHLKELSAWTDKATKTEKWLTMKDLAGISKHKPLWLVQIHKKVKEHYEKAFDASGNPK